MPQSQVKSIDAPVAGWNAYASLDSMPENAAIILDNIIPGAGHCDTREGYIEYYDLGTGEPVETVVSFNSSAYSKLIVASDGGVWDATDTSGPLTVKNLAAQGTYTNSRWQTRNFRKADEEGIMIMCNGVDSTQIVTLDEPNKPILTDMVATEDAVTIASDFIGVEVFKGRCYYWRDDDDAFYYTEAGAYQGALARFPLGAFVQLGGKLKMVATWSQNDSGDGKDDFLVFMFSTGEILIYQGDDPGGVGFFEMVGRYNTGIPLSVRGKAKFGADIILMTKDGYIGLSSIIQDGRTSDVAQFSRTIHTAIVDQTALTGDNYGWEAILFAKKGLMLFNVPVTDETFNQHVLNTVTGAWCRFTGINVNCLNVHNERLFGGTNDGKVYALLESTSDNAQPIYFTCLYAYSYMDDPGYNKHLVAAQVLTTHSRPEYIQMSGYADYDVPNVTTVQIPSGATTATWATNVPATATGSFWDESYWGMEGVQKTYKGWQNVSAYGYAVALLVRFAKLNEGVRWRSTTLRYFRAGAQ